MKQLLESMDAARVRAMKAWSSNAIRGQRSHPICDACECVAHCLRNGCIPVQPLPEIDPGLIPAKEQA